MFKCDIPEDRRYRPVLAPLDDPVGATGGRAEDLRNHDGFRDQVGIPGDAGAGDEPSV